MLSASDSVIDVIRFDHLQSVWQIFHGSVSTIYINSAKIQHDTVDVMHFKFPGQRLKLLIFSYFQVRILEVFGGLWSKVTKVWFVYIYKYVRYSV